MDGLTAVTEALTTLAFAAVSRTGRPASSFVGVLDPSTPPSSGEDLQDPGQDDHYRLGLLVGMIAHTAACRDDSDGELMPVLTSFRSDTPAAVAAAALRDAVLGFAGPIASQPWPSANAALSSRPTP